MKKSLIQTKHEEYEYNATLSDFGESPNYPKINKKFKRFAPRVNENNFAKILQG